MTALIVLDYENLIAFDVPNDGITVPSIFTTFKVTEHVNGGCWDDGNTKLKVMKYSAIHIWLSIRNMHAWDVWLLALSTGEIYVG